MQIRYYSKEFQENFREIMVQYKKQDAYQRAIVYTMDILQDTRSHASSGFDFENTAKRPDTPGKVGRKGIRPS